MEHPLDRVRDSGGDRFHRSAERLLARCLDEQVQVIALDREVHDARIPALTALAKAASELADERPSPKRRDITLHAQCDVRRAITRKRLPSHVIHDRSRPARPTST